MKIHKNIIIRFIKSYMNLKLSSKMIIGYVFIILLPTLSLEALYYKKNIDWVNSQYISNEKSNLSSSTNNFEQKIHQIEPLVNIFQSNKSLVDYMQGNNITEGEELYSYLKNVLPIFSYARSSFKIIDNIQAYKYKKTYLSLISDIIDSEYFQDDINIIKSLDILKGKWIFHQIPNGEIEATYYKNIYSKGYVDKLGFVEIVLSGDELFDMFSNLNEKLYMVINDTEVYKYSLGEFIPIYENKNEANSILDIINGNPSAKLESRLISQIYIDDFELHFIYVLKNTSTFLSQGISVVIIMIILIIILSILYYVIYTSISRRVIALDQYIVNSQADSLKPMLTPHYNDEIGSLTDSYNNMINRINNLIDNAYKSELLRKDSEFYALQAQIKPHFLYNVLENIRMCAETNNDVQVSNMIFTLVKYMRYNTKISVKSVKFSEELEHINYYLEICKIRLGDKLKIIFAIDTDISKVFCPRFIFQPIVENSIKYGISNNKRFLLKIDVSNTNNNLDIEVKITDNGIGILPAQLEKIISNLNNNANILSPEIGIGLKNVNDRLKLFYGPNYGLNIDSVPGKGTVVSVLLRRQGEKANEDNNC